MALPMIYQISSIILYRSNWKKQITRYVSENCCSNTDSIQDPDSILVEVSSTHEISYIA